MSPSAKPPIDITVRMFGAFQVSPDNPKLRTRKTELLAALLALNPGRLFPRDQLAADLWPESTPEAARQSLRMAVADLRAKLGPRSIQSSRDQIGFDPAQVTSDIAELDRLITEDKLEEALNLVQGPFLPGFDHPWVVAESLRLTETVSQAAVRLAETATTAPQRQTAITLLKQILVHLGCREDLHVALMKLYLAEGLPSLAIAQFETLERDLNDLWGEPPSPAAWAVIDSAPKPRTRSEASQPALPTDPHGLIGRNAELAELLERLQNPAGTLLTLLGTGGTGKTALARATLQELADRNHPVAFVDLTSAKDRKAALGKIVADLGLPDIDPNEAVSVLARKIRQEQGVYVLDNLEQLGNDAPTLVRSILEAAPQTRLLVTTRTPLGLPQEQVVRLSPLTVPSRKATLEDIRLAPAVRLFERQARQASPTFALTSDNAGAVVELCRRLDGLPLPIILAASRIVVRSPAQILADLLSALRPLGLQEGLSTRHQSTQAAVQWSLDLLPPQERTALLDLSVVQGQFDESAAMAFVALPDPFPALTNLVKSSLLNADSNGPQTVFWLYETVRQVLLQTLAEENRQDQAYNKLLRHSLAYARQIEANNSLASWQKLRRQLANSENALAAVRHSLESGQTDPDVARLAVIVQPALYAYHLGDRITPLLKTIFHWPKETLPDPLRARIGTAWVTTLANAGDVDEMSRILNDCLALAQNDPETEFIVRYKNAGHLKTLARYDEAKTELDWLLQNGDPQDRQFQSWALHSQGLVACCINQRKESLEYHKAAYEVAKHGDDLPLLIRILYDLGSELAHHGDTTTAVERFQQAIALSQKTGSAKLEGLTLWQLADALLSMDKPRKALKQLKQSIALIEESGFLAAQKWIFLKAGEAAAKCGHPEFAVRLLAKGKETRTAENRPLAEYEEEDLQKATAPLKESLGPERFQYLWHQGAATAWPDLWRDFKTLS